MARVRRAVIAGMIANGLAWYNFTLYGYFAPLIGKFFFPGHDKDAHLIAAYGVFAAGFLMRPAGAVVFGMLGDRYGRKFSLAAAILIMAVSTALIGILPTYEAIGIAAPILLTIIRLLQGVALAGEYSGAMVFTVEHAPIHKRGFAGSFTVVSLCAGMLLGSLTAMVLSATLNQQDFESWGWRIPFLLGLCSAFMALYIAYHTEETPHYEQAKQESRLSGAPLSQVMKGHFVSLLRGIGIYFSVTVPFYTLTVYSTGFISHGLGLSLEKTYIINSISMVMLVILLPLTAYLSDRYGRKLVLMRTTIAFFVTALPIFWLMEHGGFFCALVADLEFTVVTAFYISSIPALLVELFPTDVRYTGMALSYNVAAVLGGFAPMIEAWLVELTGSRLSVAVCIMLCAAISFVAFLGYRDHYKQQLR
ncbi:MAG TPA: MFS transporter [Rickettsiales bacterium]|nr:MFS transporter [Rickettsiales bacterium]